MDPNCTRDTKSNCSAASDDQPAVKWREASRKLCSLLVSPQHHFCSCCTVVVVVVVVVQLLLLYSCCTVVVVVVVAAATTTTAAAAAAVADDDDDFAADVVDDVAIDVDVDYADAGWRGPSSTSSTGCG